MAGTGKIVEVQEGHVNSFSAGYVGGRNLIVEKYEQQESLVKDMTAREIVALETLKDLLSVGSLPDGTLDVLRDVVLNPLTLIERGTTGTVPLLTLPDDWPTDIPILQVLQDAPDVDLGYDTPEKPDQPGTTMDFTERNYESVIWEPLANAILNGINNGGTSFSETIQTLLLSQGQVRQKTIRDAAYQQAIDGIGSDGFDLPGGAEAAVLQGTINQSQEEDSALNRDVTIKMAELTDLNTRFMLDKGATLEQLARDFHNNRENRSLEAEKEIAQFVLAKYSALLEGVKNDISLVELDLNAKVKTAEVIWQNNKIRLDAYTGGMEGFKAHTDAVKSKTDGVVDGYRGKIEAFKATQQEKTDYWKALTDEQRNTVLSDELRLKQAVDEVNAIIGSTLSDNKLKTGITEAIANIVAQVLASALASVNTGITHTTGRRESRNEGWVHRSGISESYPHKLEPESI